MAQDTGFQERIGRIDELVRKLEAGADPALRAIAKDLMQSVMDLHAATLDRLLEIVAKAGDGGVGLVDELGADDLVGSVLVLYGLHPADFETRVRRGIEKVVPLLRSRGATVDVLEIDGDRVTMRLHTNGHGGCGSTADGLKSAIQDAIYGAAPDVATLVVEPVERQSSGSGFVPLESLAGGVSLKPVL
jgi:Fe-S cluster biogenesis protein NfuA